MLKIFNQLPRWLRLGTMFPLAFLNGWLLIIVIHRLEPLVSIFITATLFSFLLDVPIRLLQQREIPRAWAIGIVLSVALLSLVLLSLILVPIIAQQSSDLLVNLPKWLETGDEQLKNLQKWKIMQKYSTYLQGYLTQFTERLSVLLQSLSSQLLTFILSTVGSVVNIFLVFVLSIFLVIYGEQVWDGIFSWMPAPWDVQLRETIRQTFEKYFTGQAILAGIISATLTLLLTLFNVPYSLLFAVMIGVATLIPFTSSLIAILISLVLMFQDFWLGTKVLSSAITIGLINDNVIAPRLIGGIIGLNPVWIIISLFLGGKLAGILGLLIAVPLASVIKKTANILRSSYTNSQKILIVEDTISL